jgi:fructosamine-3-kinase
VIGDLWDGNVSFHAETDQFDSLSQFLFSAAEKKTDQSRPYIYDASAFWGHNECAHASLLLSSGIPIMFTNSQTTYIFGVLPDSRYKRAS